MVKMMNVSLVKKGLVIGAVIAGMCSSIPVLAQRGGGHGFGGGHGGGGHAVGGHGRGRGIGLGLGVGLGLGAVYWGYPYWYNYPPYYYAPAPAVVPPATWYYCDRLGNYYPYVTDCPDPWRPVQATP